MYGVVSVLEAHERFLGEEAKRNPIESLSSCVGVKVYLDPRGVVNVMSTQAGRQVILSTIRANAPIVHQDLR